MISKENIKYYVFIAFITILIYKFIDSPENLLSNIKGLFMILSPFFIGILFSLLIDPLMVFLEKKFNIKRILSLLISYIGILSLVSICANMIIPSLINTLSTLLKEIPYCINTLETVLTKHISNLDLLKLLIYKIEDGLNILLKELNNLSSKTSTDILNYILSITSLFFNILMGLILSFYILYDKEKIILGCKNLLNAITTTKKANSFIEFFKTSNYIFYHYIVGRILDSLIIGILAFLGFKFLIKIDNAIFLSFIVFLTNIIPYFGPFIGAILPISMTFLYSPLKALWVFVFIFILQQIDGNIIGPKIMGDQVGLSPLWVISAVLIGGSLFGVLGVFLSVPFAALIKICLSKYINNQINIKDSK